MYQLTCIGRGCTPIEVKKGRVFWIIVYPEGIRYNEIIEKLQGLHTEIAVSPLHAPEKDPVNQKEKKPHFHIIFKFSGNKTNVQLYTMLFAMDLVSHCPGYREGDTDGNIERCIQLVDDVKVAARYLIHADHPEKQQFDLGFQAIKCLHGFDLSSAMANNYSERFAIYSEIIAYCKDNNCYWYSDLIDHCYAKENFRWLNYLMTNSFTVQLYLSSFTKKQEYIKNQKEKELQIQIYERSLGDLSDVP